MKLIILPIFKHLEGPIMACFGLFCCSVIGFLLGFFVWFGFFQQLVAQGRSLLFPQDAEDSNVC